MENTLSPEKTVKLVFMHHSCGRNWLMDDKGGLANALTQNNYFVSDTNYQWGPDHIGDHTDIGHWWSWFRGERSKNYMEAVLNESGQHSDYSRHQHIAEGENEIIMFKSCYPNSNLKGSVSDPVPPIEENPLKGEDCNSEHHTVSNAKGIYIDLLNYFQFRQDKLFVVITAPPLLNPQWSEQARLFNLWLVNDWLSEYPFSNVRVFDFYHVLTSNGGDANTHDAGAEAGHHHRVRNGRIEHTFSDAGNTAMYPLKEGDSHPSPAGNIKATLEFIPMLNSFYHRWQATR